MILLFLINFVNRFLDYRRNEEAQSIFYKTRKQDKIITRLAGSARSVIRGNKDQLINQQTKSYLSRHEIAQDIRLTTSFQAERSTI